jgi:hypothetical protein
MMSKSNRGDVGYLVKYDIIYYKFSRLWLFYLFILNVKSIQIHKSMCLMCPYKIKSSTKHVKNINLSPLTALVIAPAFIKCHGQNACEYPHSN